MGGEVEMEIPAQTLATIRAQAATGFSDGVESFATRAYVDRCTLFHGRSGTIVLFTRDVGHHSSGWMKNPDYERCLHLSLSFREPQPQWPMDRLARASTLARLGGVFELAPFDQRLASIWAEQVLYPHARLAWIESPKSEKGKLLGVMHWRIFCDEAWAPIKPRGEVYSTDFTEKGWRSWSELNREQPSHVSAD